jgi:hypothetical protein
MQSERPAGVEPAHPPWQGDRLPLHHGRDMTKHELQITLTLSPRGEVRNPSPYPSPPRGEGRSEKPLTLSLSPKERGDNTEKSTRWDSNPRYRVTKAASSPLDDECLGGKFEARISKSETNSKSKSSKRDAIDVVALLC